MAFSNSSNITENSTLVAIVTIAPGKKRRDSIVPADCVWMTVGIVTLTASILILSTVLRNAKLRSIIHYRNICHMASAYALFAILYIAWGFERLLLSLLNVDDFLTKWPCLITQTLSTFLKYTPLTTSCLMMISRIYAVVLPFGFRTLDPKKMSLANAICWLIPVILPAGLLAAAFIPQPPPPICLYGAVFDLDSWPVLVDRIAGNIFLAANVTAWFVLSVALRWALRKSAKGKALERQETVKKSMRQSKMAFYVGINLICTFVVQRGINDWGPYFIDAYTMTTVILPITPITVLAGGATDLIIYLFTDKNFRNSFLGREVDI